MCMCESDHRWRPPSGASWKWRPPSGASWKQFLGFMEAVSGQTGITVSCIKHVIQVYLKKNTIRIIMTRMYNIFSEPKCD